MLSWDDFVSSKICCNFLFHAVSPERSLRGRPYADIKEKKMPWNYASELTEQELETSLTFRETSAAPDTPPNPPTIHQPPSPEHRRRCNHPLCMEQHAQRRRWWSLFSPPLLLPALISEEVDVVDQTAVGCVGRSEDGLPSVLWSVSHPKQEIGLYY